MFQCLMFSKGTLNFQPNIIGRQSLQVSTACKNSSTPATPNKVICSLSQTQRTPSVSKISAESDNLCQELKSCWDRVQRIQSVLIGNVKFLS